MSEQSPQELSLKTAELLGRQLFSAFMNLSGYGREHPVTKKSIDALFSNLSELARQLYGLTLLLERDQLYAEKHPIGSRERARRLVGIFGDIGLESVSFEPEIDKNSLEEFLLILTTPKNFSSPEEIREELVRRGASRIRLNYVVFRKLTRDQHVSEGSEDPRLETDRIGTGDAAKAGQQTGAPVLQQPPAKTNGRPRATSPKLPERVLSAANIAYFLDREIKSAFRYQTVFSCAMVTIDAVHAPGKTDHMPDGAEISSLLPEFYELLFHVLRDLDLVGSLDRQHRTVPLIILPMTPHGNANVVRLRLSESLDNARFELNGETVRLKTTVTTLGFHPQTDKDIKGFLAKLREHHRETQDQNE
jgi:hypothetical protein